MTKLRSGSSRMMVYESSLHRGDALVRSVAPSVTNRVLLVGGRGAAMLAPLLLAIAAEHGCTLTVYTRSDWRSAVADLVKQHHPDVVLVESSEPPQTAIQATKIVWLQPRAASTPLEYAAWAAQAWRAAQVRRPVLRQRAAE